MPGGPAAPLGLLASGPLPSPACCCHVSTGGGGSCSGSGAGAGRLWTCRADSPCGAAPASRCSPHDSRGAAAGSRRLCLKMAGRQAHTFHGAWRGGDGHPPGRLAAYGFGLLGPRRGSGAAPRPAVAGGGLDTGELGGPEERMGTPARTAHAAVPRGAGEPSEPGAAAAWAAWHFACGAQEHGMPMGRPPWGEPPLMNLSHMPTFVRREGHMDKGYQPFTKSSHRSVDG